MDVDVVPVAPGADGMLRGDAVRAALEEHGASVFAVVATAGSTNFGIVDDVASIAALKEEFDFWLHVDGAYGLAAMLSPLARHRFAGVEHADSVIVDPHKWLFAPFDACALIYRDPETGRRAHTQHAEYLDTLTETSEWSPSDYAAHLTRRARGLPLWFSLATYGGGAYRAAITSSIQLAQDIAREIESPRRAAARARPAALGRRVRARGLVARGLQRVVGAPARRAARVRDAELARRPPEHALRDREPDDHVRAAGGHPRHDVGGRMPRAAAAADAAGRRPRGACRAPDPGRDWRASRVRSVLAVVRRTLRRGGGPMNASQPLSGRNAVVTGAPAGSGRPRPGGSSPWGRASPSSAGIETRLAAAAEDLGRTTGTDEVDVFEADLSSQAQVRRLAADCRSATRGSTCWSTTSAGSGRTATSPRTGSN